MLSIVVTPLRTKAVVAEISAGVVLVCSALLAACGIAITSNNDTICSNFLDSCCDDLRNWIYDVGDTWSVGYKKVLEVSAEMWDNLEVDAHKHFKNFLQSSDNINFISVSENLSDIYGFTDDESTQLKFHVPSIPEAGGYATLFADNYKISYYYNYLIDDINSFTGFTIHFSGSNDITFANFDGVRSNPYSGDFSGFDISCDFVSYIPSYQIGYSSYLVDYFTLGRLANGHNIAIQNDSNGYFVRDLFNNSVISLNCKGQSKTYFSSVVSIFEWLFEDVGLAHQNTAGLFDVALPATDTSFNDVATGDVVIDKDYFPTDEDVESVTKEAVSIVVPATLEDVCTETVLNKDSDDVYPSDKFPDIDIPISIWDKFPFCLPKDLYNLFCCFFSESSSSSAPPPLEIPINLIYAEHTVVIDFTDENISSNDDNVTHIGLGKFDILVKILRFFISLSFVYGLIVLSRKLIGA